MLGFRVMSGLIGLGGTLLFSLHAAAQPAAPGASAGFPTEPATSEPARAGEAAPPPPSTEPTPPVAGTTPPEVPPPPPPAAAPAPPAPFEPSPPPARASRGPVVGFRTGYAIPMGKYADEPTTTMSNAFSGQVPILVELGWRPIPTLFFGGYLGIGFGGAAGREKDVCELNDASCVAFGARIGLELQYHFLPDEQVDPWLGYGIGLEVLSLVQQNSEHEASDTLSGFEYAHFMGGVDFRVSKRFGLGPVVDLALGRFQRLSTELDGRSQNRKIENQASHQWLTLGVRGVFYR